MALIVLILFIALPAIIGSIYAGATGTGYGGYMAMALCSMAIMLFVLCIIDACQKVKRPESRKKLIKEQKTQEKYDNEWGTINWIEKDK